MLRTYIAPIIAYGCGHPILDGNRPALLERPLQSIYADVKATARDGRGALATLDDARCMRYLKVYVDRMESQLRSVLCRARALRIGVSALLSNSRQRSAAAPPPRTGGITTLSRRQARVSTLGQD
jgi:hypothetical protein